MTDMPIMRAAFRTTVSGDGKYEMVFRFPSMDAMHAADDEWRAALNQPAAPVEAVAGGEARIRHDERKKIIAQGCIHTRKAGAQADYDRPDVSAWQADQQEWFDPTICKIVSEYAAWRDAHPTEPTASTVAKGEVAALRSSLQGLLNACYMADAAEELPSQIDGALLDEARDALELQYPVIWTDHQVAMLRGRQSDGSMHPYTCGGDRSDATHVSQSEEDAEIAGLLYPTARGWMCPACDYRQFWSHETGGPATHHKGSSDGQ